LSAPGGEVGGMKWFWQGKPKVINNYRQLYGITLRCGFFNLVKLWDKCINVGGDYVEK
jgi:hypothetical protein